jgi:hypothetical protein
MSKKNNNHRKKKKPDCDSEPFGAPVEEDGNNKQNQRDAGPKEDPAFEISIDWKLDAERRAWLAALNEDICPPGGINDRGSNITDVV